MGFGVMLSSLVIWPSISATAFVTPSGSGVVQLGTIWWPYAAAKTYLNHVLLQTRLSLIICSVFCVFPGFFRVLLNKIWQKNLELTFSDSQIWRCEQGQKDETELLAGGQRLSQPVKWSEVMKTPRCGTRAPYVITNCRLPLVIFKLNFPA